MFLVGPGSVLNHCLLIILLTNVLVINATDQVQVVNKTGSKLIRECPDIEDFIAPNGNITVDVPNNENGYTCTFGFINDVNRVLIKAIGFGWEAILPEMIEFKTDGVYYDGIKKYKYFTRDSK